MTAEPSNTFCVLPWIHIYANPDGSVLPCCVAEHHIHMGNVQENSLIEIWNNDKYRELRTNMLTGQRSTQCSSCYRSEDRGVKSVRQDFNKRFDKYIGYNKLTRPDGSLAEMSLRYFDVRWSNICNFKCRSCSSTYSSSWATEDNQNGNNKKVFIFAGGPSNDLLYYQFLPHFENIEEFYFAGGEPLLTDKHYDILNHLIKIGRTDVKLTYNTNLSNLKYKNQSVIDLWKQFKQVEVYASLDSWGPRAEYIREGTEWAVIEDNIKTIRRELPNLNLQMSSVISAFNLYTLTDFLDYLFENKIFSVEKFWPSFYNIMNPYYYSSQIFDDAEKAKIVKKLSSKSYGRYLDSQIANVINYVNNGNYDPGLKTKFKIETKNFDQIRNRDFESTFPELKDWYNNE